jgi:solute carrier family 25 citrate transporter 1
MYVSATAHSNRHPTRPDEAHVWQPTEYVKTRAQLAKKQAGHKIDPKASRLTEIIKQTYRTNGISGFYRGAVPVVFGNALKAGTRFFTFEVIRDLLKDKETGRLTPAKNMLGKRVFLERN